MYIILKSPPRPLPFDADALVGALDIRSSGELPTVDRAVVDGQRASRLLISRKETADPA